MPVSVAPARRAAFTILQKIEQGQGNSDNLLHASSIDRLSMADRNLCTALVLGVLRWQRVLDAICRRFLSRPNQPLPGEVCLALRIGAFQLLFLDRIPPHAAIFESVEWTKQSTGIQQAGLVNAILRKVAAPSVAKPTIMDAELAYPEWMVARWKKNYGIEATKCLCRQGQTEPVTTMRVFSAEEEQAFSSEGVTLQPGSFLAKARLVAKGTSDTVIPTMHFQDEGSQLVAELLGQGKHILDCCAAPGGKTAVLLQNNPEAQVLACDIHPQRLDGMRMRLSRLAPMAHVEYRNADASRLRNAGPFDRILCDVPCSGTGTLARNPEIRHRLQPQDLVRHAERQRLILSAALRLLGPGGRLLYSTCSIEPEENEAVVDACLHATNKAQAIWNRLDLVPEFDRLEQAGMIRGDAAAMLRATGFRNGYMRTIPGLHPCDGFFAALIERRKR